jgi:hypothetical protein
MGCGIAPTFPSRASGHLSIGEGENDRDGPRVTFALMLAAGARLRLVALARVKQTSCDHLTASAGLHATIASGRVGLSMDGGAANDPKIATDGTGAPPS